jgi:outer membrane autotransporter protein
MFQAGAYARHGFGAAYVAAALAYGWQDTTTSRNVLGSQLRAEFNASALSGRVEAGYRLDAWSVGVTPYAAGQFTTFFLPAYVETSTGGVSVFPLAYDSKDVTAPRSELGVRADKSFVMDGALVTLRGRAAWAHNFNTDRNVSAIFQALPASAFVVNGASPTADAALVSLSTEVRWANGLSLAGSFEGEFSSRTEGYSARGIVRYQW